MVTRSTKAKTAIKTTKAATKSSAAKTTTTTATPMTMTTASPKADVVPVGALPVGGAPVTGMPKAVVVETVKTVVADAPIKKPELIERVMAETGMKKKDVKPFVEAMLTVLGRALIGGEELTVPTLGKLMINRSKEVSNATIVNIKLRHPFAVKTHDDAPITDPIVATLE
jgi:nucleoid DNA-binding protein